MFLLLGRHIVLLQLQIICCSTVFRYCAYACAVDENFLKYTGTVIPKTMKTLLTISFHERDTVAVRIISGRSVILTKVEISVIEVYNAPVSAPKQQVLFV